MSEVLSPLIRLRVNASDLAGTTKVFPSPWSLELVPVAADDDNVEAWLATYLDEFQFRFTELMT